MGRKILRSDFFKVISFLLILVIVGTTAKRHHLEIAPDSPIVFSVWRTWWGLKTEREEIHFMQRDGYDYPTWWAKSADGDWYPYLVPP